MIPEPPLHSAPALLDVREIVFPAGSYSKIDGGLTMYDTIKSPYEVLPPRRGSFSHNPSMLQASHVRLSRRGVGAISLLGCSLRRRARRLSTRIARVMRDEREQRQYGHSFSVHYPSDVRKLLDELRTVIVILFLLHSLDNVGDVEQANEMVRASHSAYHANLHSIQEHGGTPKKNTKKETKENTDVKKKKGTSAGVQCMTRGGQSTTLALAMTSAKNLIDALKEKARPRGARHELDLPGVSDMLDKIMRIVRDVDSRGASFGFMDESTRDAVACRKIRVDDAKYIEPVDASRDTRADIASFSFLVRAYARIGVHHYPDAVRGDHRLKKNFHYKQISAYDFDFGDAKNLFERGTRASGFSYIGDVESRAYEAQHALDEDQRQPLFLEPGLPNLGMNSASYYLHNRNQSTYEDSTGTPFQNKHIRRRRDPTDIPHVLLTGTIDETLRDHPDAHLSALSPPLQRAAFLRIESAIEECLGTIGAYSPALRKLEALRGGRAPLCAAATGPLAKLHKVPGWRARWGGRSVSGTCSRRHGRSCGALTSAQAALPKACTAGLRSAH